MGPEQQVSRRTVVQVVARNGAELTLANPAVLRCRAAGGAGRATTAIATRLALSSGPNADVCRRSVVVSSRGAHSEVSLLSLAERALSSLVLSASFARFFVHKLS